MVTSFDCLNRKLYSINDQVSILYLISVAIYISYQGKIILIQIPVVFYMMRPDIVIGHGAWPSWDPGLAYRQFSPKPLPGSKLAYCQLNTQEYISLKSYLNFNNLLKKCIWRRLQNCSVLNVFNSSSAIIPHQTNVICSLKRYWRWLKAKKVLSIVLVSIVSSDCLALLGLPI